MAWTVFAKLILRPPWAKTLAEFWTASSHPARGLRQNADPLWTGSDHGLHLEEEVGQEMKTVEDYARIRYAFHTEHKKIREIAREAGVADIPSGKRWMTLSRRHMA